MFKAEPSLILEVTAEKVDLRCGWNLGGEALSEALTFSCSV